MRPLRWKGRYRSGDAEIDRRNRAFVDCVNSLIQAAGKREHCQEMENFIDRFSARAEKALEERATDGDLSVDFGRQLMESLPLDSYGSAACRACGLCDLAQKKVAEHLQTPAECLFRSS